MPSPSAGVSPPGQRFLRRVLSDRGAWGDDDELDLDAVLADDEEDDDGTTAEWSPVVATVQSALNTFQTSPGTLTGTAASLIPVSIAEQDEDELVDVDGSVYGGK